MKIFWRGRGTDGRIHSGCEVDGVNADCYKAAGLATCYMQESDGTPEGDVEALRLLTLEVSEKPGSPEVATAILSELTHTEAEAAAFKESQSDFLKRVKQLEFPALGAEDRARALEIELAETIEKLQDAAGKLGEVYALVYSWWQSEKTNALAEGRALNTPLFCIALNVH